MEKYDQTDICLHFCFSWNWSQCIFSEMITVQDCVFDKMLPNELFLKLPAP